MLLRLLAPSSGTAAFNGKVVALLGSAGTGDAKAEGMRGPAATCTVEGSVTLRDGGISVAVCTADAAAPPASLLYLLGRGSGAVGEEGAGGLAVAEVQMCAANSASRLFELQEQDTAFRYPRLARVDLRAGLLRLDAGGAITQLAPTLAARQFLGGAKHSALTTTTAALAALAMVGLAAAVAVGWQARRVQHARSDPVEREGLKEADTVEADTASRSA